MSLGNKNNKKKTPMRNITINLPNCYDDNIKKLIALKILPSRSEAVRSALREFFGRELKNLKLLEFIKKKEE